MTTPTSGARRSPSPPHYLLDLPAAPRRESGSETSSDSGLHVQLGPMPPETRRLLHRSPRNPDLRASREATRAVIRQSYARSYAEMLGLAADAGVSALDGRSRAARVVDLFGSDPSEPGFLANAAAFGIRHRFIAATLDLARGEDALHPGLGASAVAHYAAGRFQAIDVPASLEGFAATTLAAVMTCRPDTIRVELAELLCEALTAKTQPTVDIVEQGLHHPHAVAMRPVMMSMLSDGLLDSDLATRLMQLVNHRVNRKMTRWRRIMTGLLRLALDTTVDASAKTNLLAVVTPQTLDEPAARQLSDDMMLVDGMRVIVDYSQDASEDDPVAALARDAAGKCETIDALKTAYDNLADVAFGFGPTRSATSTAPLRFHDRVLAYNKRIKSETVLVRHAIDMYFDAAPGAFRDRLMADLRLCLESTVLSDDPDRDFAAARSRIARSLHLQAVEALNADVLHAFLLLHRITDQPLAAGRTIGIQKECEAILRVGIKYANCLNPEGGIHRDCVMGQAMQGKIALIDCRAADGDSLAAAFLRLGIVTGPRGAHLGLALHLDHAMLKRGAPASLGREPLSFAKSVATRLGVPLLVHRPRSGDGYAAFARVVPFGRTLSFLPDSSAYEYMEADAATLGFGARDSMLGFNVANALRVL